MLFTCLQHVKRIYAARRRYQLLVGDCFVAPDDCDLWQVAPHSLNVALTSFVHSMANSPKSIFCRVYVSKSLGFDRQLYVEMHLHSQWECMESLRHGKWYNNVYLEYIKQFMCNKLCVGVWQIGPCAALTTAFVGFRTFVSRFIQ